MWDKGTLKIYLKILTSNKRIPYKIKGRGITNGVIYSIDDFNRLTIYATLYDKISLYKIKIILIFYIHKNIEYILRKYRDKETMILTIYYSIFFNSLMDYNYEDENGKEDFIHLLELLGIHYIESDSNNRIYIAPREETLEKFKKIVKVIDRSEKLDRILGICIMCVNII